MVKISKNAMEVLKRRYLLKDKNGKLIENPAQMFKRVAKFIAKNKVQEREFSKILSNLDFLPNSPTLMNANTRIGQLSACFVLDIEDSLDSIFENVKISALIQQSGGGVGYSFSKLRPKGDIVGSTKGIASGPVSFMNVFNEATNVIRQGGKRRGANMAVLSVTHPDIEEFITVKQDPNKLTNFNLSVAMTDKFMKAVEKNQSFDLIHPKTKKSVKKVNARELFSLIVESAWKTGDPGLLFIDEINRHNPLKERIEATNPCGEVAALPFESCNLGSINLSHMVKNKQIDWNKLKYTIPLAIQFLDNVIDKNKYILPEIEEMTKANRRIGLGVMGLADFLIKLNIPYNSEEAVKTAEKVMKFINEEAHKESESLAKKYRPFPSFKKTNLRKKRRNIAVTTIAPTGTISMIANCSSGIEPLFGIMYEREILDHTKFLEINPLFYQYYKPSKREMRQIAQTGSIKRIQSIPERIKKIFVTALDINPEDHVRMQAIFQKYTDNAVSKTVNLKKNAAKHDVEKIFKLAYKLKCKGITLYRYGSKPEQVLKVALDYSGGCPEPTCPH